MDTENLSLPLAEGQAAFPERRCRQCGERKPLNEFVRQGYGRQRRICKACQNARQRALYAKNPERKAYQDRWRRENAEKKRAYYRTSYVRMRSALRSSIAKTLSTTRASCKRRSIECTVTPDEVVALFNAQSGLCALTGRALQWGTKGLHRDTLSIDRIDQSRGYVPDNIRLVTYQANFARNRFSDAELFEFCETVLAWRNRSA